MKQRAASSARELTSRQSKLTETNTPINLSRFVPLDQSFPVCANCLCVVPSRPYLTLLTQLTFWLRLCGAAFTELMPLAAENAKDPLNALPAARRLGLEEGLFGRGQIQLEEEADAMGAAPL